MFTTLIMLHNRSFVWFLVLRGIDLLINSGKGDSGFRLLTGKSGISGFLS